MCGITAYIGEYPAFKYILEGLLILQNRGYDSAGITTLSLPNTDNKEQVERQFITTKFANDPGTTNSIEKIKTNANHHDNHLLGIGHTRWATHGSKSDANAHPHLDYHGHLALVHNGIIENYLELKKFLLEKDYQFYSETDTEVISNLISYYFTRDSKLCQQDAITRACQQLRGTWGLAIIFISDPNHIYVSRNGSPILIGYNDTLTIIASESSAFVNSVNKYVIVKDHEILKIGIHNPSQNQTFVEKYDVKNIAESNLIRLTPDPYPHWMLREIMEQPDSILRSLNMGGRIQNEYNVRLGGLQKYKHILCDIEHLLIIAMGTSYHAALFGAKFFRLLKGVGAVTVLDASEFTDDNIPIDIYGCKNEKTGYLFLSQSGETKDVHLAMEIVKKHSLSIFSIVNVVDSLIAREADCGIYLNAGREVAVASTKSFTSQAVVLILVAIWFAQTNIISKNLRHQLIQEIYNLSTNFQELSKKLSNINNVENPLQKIVDILKDKECIFLLGRQMGHPIALEGALKIKEVSYIHAEGYPGGALKHGPFALIEDDTPVIILAFQDEWQHKMHITAEEVKARGAKVILITDIEEKNIPNGVYHYVIHMKSCGLLSPLLSILPLQLLSYHLSVACGHNPDYPRNLAKCVTTE